MHVNSLENFDKHFTRFIALIFIVFLVFLSSQLESDFTIMNATNLQTVSEFAEEKGLSRQAVYLQIKKGELKTKKVGKSLRVIVSQKPANDSDFPKNDEIREELRSLKEQREADRIQNKMLCDRVDDLSKQLDAMNEHHATALKALNGFKDYFEMIGGGGKPSILIENVKAESSEPHFVKDEDVEHESVDSGRFGKKPKKSKRAEKSKKKDKKKKKK